MLAHKCDKSYPILSLIIFLALYVLKTNLLLYTAKCISTTSLRKNHVSKFSCENDLFYTFKHELFYKIHINYT